MSERDKRSSLLQILFTVIICVGKCVVCAIMFTLNMRLEKKYLSEWEKRSSLLKMFFTVFICVGKCVVCAIKFTLKYETREEKHV